MLIVFRQTVDESRFPAATQSNKCHRKKRLSYSNLVQALGCYSQCKTLKAAKILIPSVYQTFKPLSKPFSESSLFGFCRFVNTPIKLLVGQGHSLVPTVLSGLDTIPPDDLSRTTFEGLPIALIIQFECSFLTPLSPICAKFFCNLPEIKLFLSSADL